MFSVRYNLRPKTVEHWRGGGGCDSVNSLLCCGRTFSLSLGTYSLYLHWDRYQDIGCVQ